MPFMPSDFDCWGLFWGVANWEFLIPKGINPSSQAVLHCVRRSLLCFFNDQILKLRPISLSPTLSFSHTPTVQRPLSSSDDPSPPPAVQPPAVVSAVQRATTAVFSVSSPSVSHPSLFFSSASLHFFPMASASSSQPRGSVSASGSATATATASSSALVKPTGKNLDIAWQWNSLKDIQNKKAVTCDFCGKTSNGGITRAKRHQMGVTGDVDKCLKTPPEVKEILTAACAKKKAEKDAYLTELQEDDDEDEEVQEIFSIRSGKRTAASSAASCEAPAIAKKAKAKGPLDLLLFKNPETTIKLGKAKRQTSMNDACDKEARARTVQYIERFLCRNGIAFNVVRSKSFKLMVEAIGNYGPHLKVPSYHECRVSLLKKELEYTKELLKPHELERENYGCSIMSDAWTDKKNRTLINFLVNCPTGSMFVKSVDASAYMKTGEKLFELLDSFVEEIGEHKVVQLVSDNGSNYVLAGKLLQAKRQHLFWTPCAAHCIDLILEDIGKIARIKKAVQRGINLVSFIYNHSLTLNIMRRFTKKSELVRHAVTRFATAFLTLQRLHNLKSNLRKMFTSDEWLQSKTAKEAKGKRATDTVLMPSFWNDVIYSLKAMGPLVQVLRLVDNEKKPAMGYIYEAMDRAKENIQNAFKGNEAKYKEIFEIIDRRWECQLHHPLHAAGHYLNPQFFYGNPRIENDPEVMEGLYKCIERLSAHEEDVDKASHELSTYRRAGGLFGLKAAIRQRVTLAPAEWWKNYGVHTPHLQNIAIKVLSLTCSSSGCERNWSIFEHVHSKKRNRLEHQRLQDLVFIKYNQALKERFECRDVVDPIVLKDVDDDSEWLLGERDDDEEGAEDDLVFEDDLLTWGAVARASGAGEPLTYTRRQTRSKNTAASGSSSRPSSFRRKGKEVIQEEEEEEYGDEEIEEEEEEEVFVGSDESENEEEMADFGDEDDDDY